MSDQAAGPADSDNPYVPDEPGGPEGPGEPIHDALADERLYTPQPGEAQLSFRAVLTGCILGGVVASMNIYFGLRTGWSIGGSLIAAILGFSVWTVLHAGGARKYSVLETNITQTAGSAAGSMASAAGLLAAIPALYLLEINLSYIELTLWAFSVAYLGVFFAVPLRNQMVVVEKLRFPTGTATAETIVSMFADGREALAQARVLLIGGIAAAVFTLAAFFVPQLGHPPMDGMGAFAVMISAWGFSLLISPLMFGAGILIGPRVAISLLLGAIASWAILGPYSLKQGWVNGPIMDYATGPRGWILWPGVAIMVADALTNLAFSWKTMVATFRPGKKDGDVASQMEDERDRVPNLWWMGGLALGTTATVIVAWKIFEIPPWMTLIAVAMSSVLAMIAVRSTGETDINPIGGMGKVTQLVFGGLGQSSAIKMSATELMTTNIMAAAITGSGASQAGDMMQDLKTGRLLGASPRKQIIAQCWGIAAGILVAVPIFKLFIAAGEKADAAGDPSKLVGGTDVPAPAAHAWKAMAEVLSEGFDKLPTNAEWAVLGGAIFGVLMVVLRRVAPPKIQAWWPSGLAFGIAFIVPAYYSVAMFLGALMFMIWKARSPRTAAVFGIAVASGLIAGEGLMGVVNSVMTLFGLGPLT